MATALAATYSAGTLTDPPRVLLAVTGAPSLTPNYISNFTTTNDGWTGSAGTFLFNQSTGAGANTLELQGADAVTSTFSRTVTGLTIGQTYRLSTMARRNLGQIALTVSGMTSGAFVSLPTRAALAYTFTATATSHVIQAKVKPDAGSVLNGSYSLDTVQVIRTTGWAGTTITRTDANGTDVVVREAPGGQDATGTTGSATMTVTDYEAALGALSYTVTDGNGGTATATVTAPTSPGVWLTLPATADPATPAPPGFAQVLMVTGWDETARSNGSLHTIIGRPDPIANPGPLLARAGALTLLCADYATAAAVRVLLAGGDVALLRQPTFPAADLYLVATEVSVAPTTTTAPTQLWTATIRYQEVAAP